MPPPVPATVDELGLQGCLYLWALLVAQNQRLPVTPTRRMTLVTMAALQEYGIIEVPWPEAKWEFDPDACTTPIEGLQWRLSWSIYEPALLIDALEDYFDSVENDDLATAVRLRLWTDLGSSETEWFFEQQLLKHRFPAEWAQDAAFVYRDRDTPLTLAQWRYCAWAAVRHGASVALQQGMQYDGLRNSIYQELRRRAIAVASGTWTGCSFPPHNPVPVSALARGFVQHVAKLGQMYWLSWPCTEAVLGSTRD